MKILETVSQKLSSAASFLSEKNRKTAALNRIRAVIRCEEKAAEKEYLALGRYYYNNLRDEGNAVAEPHCKELDAIEQRLDTALQQLEKLYSEEEDREEVDLSDVTMLDGDPEEKGGCGCGCSCSKDAPEAAAKAPAAEVPEEPEEEPEPNPVEEMLEKLAEETAPAMPDSPSPAFPDRNDSLPFEG